MRSRRTPWTLPAIMVVGYAFSGCGPAGDELPREAVSGSVTFEGKPLSRGSILFLPAGADMATGGGAMVADGKFSIARAYGLVPGSYQVSITAASSESETKPGEAPGSARPLMKGMKELIPPQYNTKSKLTREVKKGGPNRFDFDLTK